MGHGAPDQAPLLLISLSWDPLGLEVTMATGPSGFALYLTLHPTPGCAVTPLPPFCARLSHLPLFGPNSLWGWESGAL